MHTVFLRCAIFLRFRIVLFQKKFCGGEVMTQEKDDFRRLTEKYENELMSYYRSHAPTVLTYSDNTRRPEPDEFERDRVSEHRIDGNPDVAELSEQEAAQLENSESAVPREQDFSENGEPPIQETLPMSPLPDVGNFVPSENGSGEKSRSRGSDGTQTTSDERPSPEKGEEVGYIKVFASTAQQAVPLPGCKVTVSSGETQVDFYSELETDISGNTPVISVPAPSRELSQTPGGNVRPYYRYNIDVEFPGYEEVNVTEVPVFEGILSIQPVSMTPASGGGTRTEDTPGFML